ncbi:hypothetical protein THS27_01660 [Thalassospira sp. MCCC 1A01428]|nr:hypothetical protein THS27_01660 [Thalassospira sp. MCCC 1A01428]
MNIYDRTAVLAQSEKIHTAKTPTNACVADQNSNASRAKKFARRAKIVTNRLMMDVFILFLWGQNTVFCTPCLLGYHL